MGEEMKGLAGLRVAVIGCGRMGIRHIRAALDLGMNVCGIMDLSDAALEEARQLAELSTADCFRDALQMLTAKRPDALVVATTAPSHASLVQTAVDCKVRFILCEKPMAVSLEEALAMQSYCEKGGSVLAVNHQMRFMPQYKEVKSLVGTLALGPLSSILIAGSNFGLAMNASHYFEMFRFISNQRVDRVQAWLEDEQLANPRGAQFEDRSGRLLAVGEAGVPMFIDFSKESGHGVQAIFTCRFGQIIVDELDGTIRVTARKPEFHNLPTPRYGMPAEVRQGALAPADIVGPTMDVWRAMLDGSNFPDGGAGAHAVACLVAAHASHEAGGRPVRLEDPGLPVSRVFPWA